MFCNLSLRPINLGDYIPAHLNVNHVYYTTTMHSKLISISWIYHLPLSYWYSLILNNHDKNVMIQIFILFLNTIFFKKFYYTFKLFPLKKDIKISLYELKNPQILPVSTFNIPAAINFYHMNLKLSTFTLKCMQLWLLSHTYPSDHLKNATHCFRRRLSGPPIK
jgi:hypothetical protein